MGPQSFVIMESLPSREQWATGVTKGSYLLPPYKRCCHSDHSDYYLEIRYRCTDTHSYLGVVVR